MTGRLFVVTERAPCIEACCAMNWPRSPAPLTKRFSSELTQPAERRIKMSRQAATTFRTMELILIVAIPAVADGRGCVEKLGEFNCFDVAVGAGHVNRWRMRHGVCRVQRCAKINPRAAHSSNGCV